MAAVVAAVANTSGLTVLLHPLVIVNISDHYARTRAQTGAANPQGRAASFFEGAAGNGRAHVRAIAGAHVAVVGALLGQQTGRTIEVSNSFELALTPAGKLDSEYARTKRDQCMFFKSRRRRGAWAGHMGRT